MEKIDHGVLIVVAGHSYYGRMAYCLAHSIKAMDSSIQIALVYNGNSMNHVMPDQFEFFDHIIKMPESVPANPICKLYGAKYSPFKKTVLLDADTLWLPFLLPSDLFKSLEGLHFTGITEGNEVDPHPNYFFWGDINEIKEKYKLKTKLHQWRSEFIYFDEEGFNILERALEITENHGLKSVMNFAHNVPDELGINIATAEAGIEPHIYKWQPTYWPMMHNNNIPAIAVLGQKYYLMSFGSNRASATVRGVYDLIMKAACMKTRRQHVFPLIQKKDFLPKERNLM